MKILEQQVKCVVGLLLGLWGVSTASPAIAQSKLISHYSVEIIDFGGSSTSIGAINDRGDILGTANYPDYVDKYILRKANGQRVNLNFPMYMSPTAINNLGWVIASSDSTEGSSIYQDGRVQAVNMEAVRDINDSGVIVGGDEYLRIPGIRLPDKSMIRPWERGLVQAINNLNQAVGYQERPEGNFPVAWFNGELLDLNVPGISDEGYPWAISNRGHVVIRIEDFNGIQGLTRTALYDLTTGTSQNLGQLTPDDEGVLGSAVNSQGIVVGGTYGHSKAAPLIWDRAHGIRNLNTLAHLKPPFAGRYRLEWAADINERGQIVGSAIEIANPEHQVGFLATPE